MWQSGKTFPDVDIAAEESVDKVANPEANPALVWLQVNSINESLMVKSVRSS